MYFPMLIGEHSCKHTGPIQLNPSIHVIGIEKVSHLPYCIYSFNIYTECKKHLQSKEDGPNANNTSDLAYFEFTKHC